MKSFMRSIVAKSLALILLQSSISSQGPAKEVMMLVIKFQKLALRDFGGGGGHKPK